MAKHLEPRPGLIEKFSKNSRNSIKVLILTLLAMTTVAASTIPGASSEVPQVTGTPVKMEERLRQAFLPPLDPQYASEKDMVLSYAELGYNSVSDFISETATNKAEREEAARIAAEKAAAEEAARLAAEEEKKRAEEARIAAEKAAAEALAREAAEDQRRQASARSAERSDPQGAKAIAAEMVADRGWDSSQFTCLDNLWERESNWNHLAKNPSSGAYGIPQSLPGNKMASVGDDWQTNPVTQITWGLGYIADRYGSPCGAWQHSEAKGWY